MPQSELATGASRFQLYSNLGQKWPGCVETRYAAGKDYDVDDTPADPANPETLFVPTFAIDEPDTPRLRQQLHQVRRQAERQDRPAQKKKRWAKYGVETDRRQSAARRLLDRPVVGAAICSI